MKKLRRIIALILTLTIISSVAAVGSTNVFAAEIDSVTDSVGDDFDNDIIDSLSKVKVTEDFLKEFEHGEVTLSPATLLEIQKYTRGRNTAIGELLYWGNNIGSALSIGIAVLEMTGVIESEHAAVMRRFDEIERKIDEIKDTLDHHTQALVRIEQAIAKSEQKSVLDNFDTNVRAMNDSLKILQGLYANAKDRYSTEVALVGEPLSDESIKPKKWLDIDHASSKEINDYCNALTDIVVEGCLKGDTSFEEYRGARNILINSFVSVTESLGTISNNPIFAYDRYCKLIYNFDSQAYIPRVAYREKLLTDMSESMAMIHMLLRSYQNSKDKNLKGYIEGYQNAVNMIYKYQPAGKAPSEISAYERLIVDPNEKYDGEYISEIKLAGREKKYEEAKKGLINQGYNLIDYDLNNGAHGFYIYMGYKTTKNYADAIKDVIILDGYRPEKLVYGGRTYTECKFENFNGDLNQGAHGASLYMYTTKDEMPDKTAIQSLEINISTKELFDSEYDRPVNLVDKDGFDSLVADLNEGTLYHKTINLFKRIAQKPELLLGQDPEYYPYCYTLNSKVSFKELQGPFSLEEAVGFEFGGRNTIFNADDPMNSRDWTLSEEELFRISMSEETLQQELLSAGIAIDYKEKIGTNASLLTLHKDNKIHLFPNKGNAPMEVKNGDYIDDFMLPIHSTYVISGIKKGMFFSPYSLGFLLGQLDESSELSERLDTKDKAYSIFSNDSGIAPSGSAILVQHDSSDYSDYADVYKVGDVNRDGVVDITDVTLIQLHLAELKTLEGKYMKAAMINNGELSINDATEIQKYLAQFSGANPYVDTYSI